MYDPIVSAFYHVVHDGLMKTAGPLDERSVGLLQRTESMFPFIAFSQWQLASSSIEWPASVPPRSEQIRPAFEIATNKAFAYAWNYYATEEDRDEAERQYDVCICYGAGIDSTIALWYAASLGMTKICVLHTDYGQAYAWKERQTIQKLITSNRMPMGCTIKLAELSPKLDCSEMRMPKGYIIPARNALLASMGSLFSDKVWIVSNYRKMDDELGAASDKGRRFFGEMTYLLSRAHKSYHQVESPFLHWTKARTIEWFCQELGKAKALKILAETISCYDGNESTWRCGRCYSCTKAALAFESLGIAEHFQFDVPPEGQTQFIEFLKRERAKGRELPTKYATLLNLD